MIIEVDVGSIIPPYEQLREQITTMINCSVLAAGDRLPSIRQLAKDLDLAAGTVARTYRELESLGLIATRGRHGTFVVGPPALTQQQREALLHDEARRFARTAHQLGLRRQDALEMVRQALHQH